MVMRILGPADPALRVLQDVLQQHREWETTLTVVPWLEYHNRLLAALKSSQTPYQAVFVPGHVWLPELVAGELLSPIDFNPLPEEIVRAYNLADIVPSVARECRYAGRLWMIPWFTDGHIFFYRADKVPLLSNDEVPTVSPQDIQHLALEVHDPPRMYALALKAHPSEIFLDWLPFLWAEGGDVLTEQEPAFTGEAGRRALGTYCSLREFCPPDTRTYGNVEIMRALNSGTVAMATTWGGQAATVLSPTNPYRNLFRFALYPTPWNATWGIALPANQPREDRRTITEILLQAASPAQDRLVTYLAGSPVRTSSYTTKYMIHYPWLRTQYEMLKRCRMLPRHPSMGEIINILSQAIYAAFIGEGNSKKILANAETDVQRILGERKP